MMFLVAVALVVAAVACLIFGLVTGSSTLFLIAAASSALAVVILWRFLAIAREKTFVSHPPPQIVPDWDRTLETNDQIEDDVRSLTAPPEVAIDGYEDMVAAEILPSLETLSVEQLEAVVRRERYGLKRQGIIARAERLIDLTRGTGLDIREQEVLQSAGAAPRKQSATKASTAKGTPVKAATEPVAKKPTRARKPPEKKPDLSL